MGRSWLGLQLLLSCALLLAAVAVEGRCCREEESASEEECHCEKRHHCMVECCKKRCHHREEECCCKKRHHHKEECCKKKHSCVEEEEADKNKCPCLGEEHPKKRHPLFEKLKETKSESSELFERMAKEEQKRIMEAAAQTEAVPHYKKEQATAYFNQKNNGPYYKHLEDGQLEFQEAIGVMVYVKMLLAKTNCTRTKEQEEAGVEYSRDYMEKEGCQLLPNFKREKHNCTFGIFIDFRTQKKALVSQNCVIMPRIKFPF